MGVHLHQVSSQGLDALLERSRSSPLTYEPIGGSLNEVTPSGLQRRSWAASLAGPGAFERGIEALRAWSVHRGAGLAVITDGPLEVGTNVAMSAPLPIGCVDITCRIVALIDEDDRFGFAYGTLPIHPECGEESFVVIRAGDAARFEVRAVSRPQRPVARLLPFVADKLQDAAVRRYLDAMQRITSS
jgi:uncharacterized protein (UPF0548 family)